MATTVLIELEAGPVFFTIPRGATLAQVSESMDEIGRRHGGRPLAIDVIFKADEESGGEGILTADPPDSLADLLAEVPRLRAYAHLMTNDRCKADQGVQETGVHL